MRRLPNTILSKRPGRMRGEWAVTGGKGVPHPHRLRRERDWAGTGKSTPRGKIRSITVQGEGYRQERARSLGEDGVNRRGGKKLLEPFIACTLMTTRSAWRSWLCCRMTSAGVPSTTRRSIAGPVGVSGMMSSSRLCSSVEVPSRLCASPVPESRGYEWKASGSRTWSTDSAAWHAVASVRHRVTAWGAYCATCRAHRMRCTGEVGGSVADVSGALPPVGTSKDWDRTAVGDLLCHLARGSSRGGARALRAQHHEIHVGCRINDAVGRVA